MSGLLARFARFLFNQTARLTYGRIEVAGRERVPLAGPVILVANHPNSVADACLVATQLTPRRVSFIAKDTLTRAPILGPLARAAGVVGVARAMDYRRNTELARERNALAVEALVPRLRAGEVIAIFGEGFSTDAHHLLPIRKGAMRFGYAAEKSAGFALGVAWVPIGILYSAKERFRSDVLIRVGTPFRLADLPAETTQEEAILEAGTQRLQRAIGDLVDVGREDLAAIIERAAALLGGPETSQEAGVEDRQRVTRLLNQRDGFGSRDVADFVGALRRYEERLAAAHLTDAIVRQRHPARTLRTSIGGIVAHGTLLLLNRYGWINSLAPRWFAWVLGGLGRRIETSRSPDGAPLVQQVAWSTYGGWLGAAISFPLQTAGVYLWAARAFGTTRALLLAAIYALTLVPSWRMYVSRRDQVHRHFARAREASLWMRNARVAGRLHAERERLARRLVSLLAEHGA